LSDVDLLIYLAVLWLGGDTEEEIGKSIAVSDGPALLIAQSDAFRAKAAQLEQILDDLVADRRYTRKAIRSKHPLCSNDGGINTYIHKQKVSMVQRSKNSSTIRVSIGRKLTWRTQAALPLK